MENSKINNIKIDNSKFLEKEKMVFELLEKSKDLDILKELAIFGLRQYNKNNKDVVETLNKISECNVLIYNLIKSNDINKELLLDTIYSWILKESTPIEFKAKYR